MFDKLSCLEMGVLGPRDMQGLQGEYGVSFRDQKVREDSTLVSFREAEGVWGILRGPLIIT